MGFWYFLILFVGIALIVVGMLNKDVSRSVKIVSMSLLQETSPLNSLNLFKFSFLHFAQSPMSTLRMSMDRWVNATIPPFR
ncbi:Hypothetical protein Tcol_1787 [Trichococcus collinsii]|uniref:Uncharacterized protein n=1 Tax=Trichococcus collinsii TaxID=157076 RepID=A0AB38A466_9LACT|nr:Hypothetical protein Tcol_1787 [Trichococcus collinsii]SEA88744.1 hypothetical protein SAMN04488525_10943 [Trichococcus collinsii]